MIFETFLWTIENGLKVIYGILGDSHLKKIDEPTVHIDDWQILRLGNHFRTFGYTVKMHVYNYVFAQAKQESIDL